MRIYLLAGVCVIMLLGCRQIDNNNTESNNPNNVQFENLSPPLDSVSGYPYPGLDTSTAYPGQANYPQNIIKTTPQPGIDPSLPIPTPQTGSGALVGHVISRVTNSPVQDVSVSLARVYRNDQGDGAFALEGASSPTTSTDGNGRFVLNNLEPAEYVIVVGNVEVNQYEIIPELSGKVKIWPVLPDKIDDIGNLLIGFD